MITTTERKLRRYQEYIGLSTDSKPTDCSPNSLYLELDTGKFFYFNNGTWQLIGGQESS